MQRRGIGVALIVVALALTGCTSSPGAAPTDAASAGSQTPTAVPTPVTAAGLVVSLDRISVTMSDGSTGESADLSDGAAVLAFLSKAFGSSPTPSAEDGYGFVSYEWDGLGLALRPDTPTYVSMGITSDHVGRLPVSTPEGIRVGSPIAEVEKVASAGTAYKPDATNAYFGLEAPPHPGTESLQHPGQVGSDYISVTLKDGVVTQLGSPGGDWQDL